MVSCSNSDLYHRKFNLTLSSSLCCMSFITAIAQVQGQGAVMLRSTPSSVANLPLTRLHIVCRQLPLQQRMMHIVQHGPGPFAVYCRAYQKDRSTLQAFDMLSVLYCLLSCTYLIFFLRFTRVLRMLSHQHLSPL